MNYWTEYSLWSKDIIFVISDGYTDGMQAWINGYHSISQTGSQKASVPRIKVLIVSTAGLSSEPLTLLTGSIWAALLVDYPYHSFSHIGIFYENVNGLLPNLDFVNSLIHIARWTGGAEVRLHNETDELGRFTWGPEFLNSDAINTYRRSVVNVLSQVRRQATGSPSGPEGVFGRFRIDSVALYGVPAEGPHGFYCMGRLVFSLCCAEKVDKYINRVVESTLRSLNNLLERFHQSFFLYIMTSTGTFISVGNYLAAPVLVGVALTVLGLSIWGSCFPKANEPDLRPVGTASLLILLTHLHGTMVFNVWSRFDVNKAASSTILSFLALNYLACSFLLARWVGPAPPQLARILKSFSLLIAGMVMAVVSTLNFSLGALMAFVQAPPLILAWT